MNSYNNKVEALISSDGQSVCFSIGGFQVKPQRYEHLAGSRWRQVCI